MELFTTFHIFRIYYHDLSFQIYYFHENIRSVTSGRHAFFLGAEKYTIQPCAFLQTVFNDLAPISLPIDLYLLVSKADLEQSGV